MPMTMKASPMSQPLVYSVTRVYVGSVDPVSKGVGAVEGKMLFMKDDELTDFAPVGAIEWDDDLLGLEASPIGFFTLDGNSDAELLVSEEAAAEAAVVQVAAATPPPPMAPMTEYEKYMAKRNAGAAPVVSAGAAAPEPPAAAPMSEYEKYMAKRRAQGQ